MTQDPDQSSADQTDAPGEVFMRKMDGKLYGPYLSGQTQVELGIDGVLLQGADPIPRDHPLAPGEYTWVCLTEDPADFVMDKIKKGELIVSRVKREVTLECPHVHNVSMSVFLRNHLERNQSIEDLLKEPRDAKTIEFLSPAFSAVKQPSGHDDTLLDACLVFLFNNRCKIINQGAFNDLFDFLRLVRNPELELRLDTTALLSGAPILVEFLNFMYTCKAITKMQHEYGLCFAKTIQKIRQALLPLYTKGEPDWRDFCLQRVFSKDDQRLHPEDRKTCWDNPTRNRLAGILPERILAIPGHKLGEEDRPHLERWATSYKTPD